MFSAFFLDLHFRLNSIDTRNSFSVLYKYNIHSDMLDKSKQAISATFDQNLILIFQVAEFLKKGKLGHGKRREDIWSRK